MSNTTGEAFSQSANAAQYSQSCPIPPTFGRNAQSRTFPDSTPCHCRRFQPSPPSNSQFCANAPESTPKSNSTQQIAAPFNLIHGDQSSAHAVYAEGFTPQRIVLPPGPQISVPTTPHSTLADVHGGVNRTKNQLKERIDTAAKGKGKGGHTEKCVHATEHFNPTDASDMKLEEGTSVIVPIEIERAQASHLDYT